MLKHDLKIFISQYCNQRLPGEVLRIETGDYTEWRGIWFQLNACYNHKIDFRLKSQCFRFLWQIHQKSNFAVHVTLFLYLMAWIMAEHPASSPFQLSRKGNWLVRTCIMNMRKVRTLTSKVPTRVTLSFISYSVLVFINTQTVMYIF